MRRQSWVNGGSFASDRVGMLPGCIRPSVRSKCPGGLAILLEQAQLLGLGDLGFGLFDLFQLDE